MTSLLQIMKSTVFTLFFLIVDIGYSQTDFDSYFDSLYFHRDEFTNKKITTYWDDSKEIRSYEFTVVNGNVSGLFRYWNKLGILVSIGTYFNDSLWSFRKENFYSDSAFKVGIWHNYLQNGRIDSFYRSSFNKEYRYRVPHGKSSTFTQLWLNNNDKLWKEWSYDTKNNDWKEKTYNSLYLDTTSINYSYRVYNLDDTDIESLERNDSIFALFNVTLPDFIRKNSESFLQTDDSTFVICSRNLGTCCPNPNGIVYQKADELFIRHSINSQLGVCDAFCTYILIYGFKTEDVQELNLRFH